jgi:hypothetical protein
MPGGRCDITLRAHTLRPADEIRMSSKTRYTTATGLSPEALDKAVANLLQEGFQLYGNPYSATRDDAVIFCQALVGEDAESMSEQLERAQSSERTTKLLPEDIPAGKQESYGILKPQA